MHFPSGSRSLISDSSKKGFTLLELLVAIAILAAAAFVATGTYRGAAEKANDGLVRTEMREIATAIRQFRQDTGYYPKTGPFALSNDGGAVLSGNLPEEAEGNAVDWFYSPANFHQLLANPLAGTGHQLENWDPETGRGWRGPYLRGFEDGVLFIGEDINDATANGNPYGDPFGGDIIGFAWGVADPFEQRRRDYKGSPYLVFGLKDGVAWIVSMGPNGDLESSDSQGDGDDIVLRID